MRLWLKTSSLAAIALALTACPGPKYPACEKDDDCKKNAAGTTINEVCVNQQCQECRDDGQCGVGEFCNSARCDKKPGYCTLDGDCGAGKICEKNACAEAQCTADGDCQQGEGCQTGRCLAAETGCMGDQQCGAGETCQDGKCMASGSTKVSRNCMPGPAAAGGEVVSLTTVNFEFDQDALTVDARRLLDQNAECIRQAPATMSIVLEGHCDERGTQEYNLALGERRASAVRGYLKNLGVAADRVRVVSKGKNQPVCNEATDDCHAKNRRVEFIQKLSR